jgi:hypothetical protein
MSFVHMLLSSHVTFAVLTHPLAPHESVVHMLLSLHESIRAVVQDPVPVQKRCGVYVLLALHIPAPQEVVAGAFWHAPPWQSPVLSHVVVIVHRLWGSIPLTTFLQVPLPSMLHAWQAVPQLAVVQQTPSVQKFPVRHSLSLVQSPPPSGFLLPHIPIMTSQIVGGLQSVLAAQAPLQAPALQA